LTRHFLVCYFYFSIATSFFQSQFLLTRYFKEMSIDTTLFGIIFLFFFLLRRHFSKVNFYWHGIFSHLQDGLCVINFLVPGGTFYCLSPYNFQRPYFLLVRFLVYQYQRVECGEVCYNTFLIPQHLFIDTTLRQLTGHFYFDISTRVLLKCQLWTF